MTQSTEPKKESSLKSSFYIFGSMIALSVIFSFGLIYSINMATLYRENQALQDVKKYTLQDHVLTIRSENDENVYFFKLPPTYTINPSDKLQIRVKNYGSRCAIVCRHDNYIFEGVFKNGALIPIQSYHKVAYRVLPEK